MKKILFLVFLAFAVNSCSVGDDTNPAVFIILPIESVIMPDVFEVGTESEILLTYRRPTDCHIFNGFYVESNENALTIAIEAVKLDQDNCMDDTENSFQIPLKFTPDEPGTYLFRFYTGTVNEVPQYEEHEVNVDF